MDNDVSKSRDSWEVIPENQSYICKYEKLKTWMSKDSLFCTMNSLPPDHSTTESLLQLPETNDFIS